MLIIADEAAVLDDPREGPFHHPPSLDHSEADLLGAALHHLQDNVSPVLGPAHEPTRVAAIHVSEFNEGKAKAGALQDALGSVPVLDVGPMHLDGKEPPVGVGQDVALRPLIFLPAS